MAVTQKDIAQKLGVSQRLISSALNGQSGVGEEMRRKIQEEAASLGYALNRAACALATGRTGQIMLCFLVSDSFSDELTHRFQLSAQLASYDLLISTIKAVERAAPPPAMDGGLFFGDVPASVQNRPAVAMQIDLRGVEAAKTGGTDVIQVVLEDAARDAMTHLLEEGCRRIAYVTVSDMMRACEPRYRAYSCAIQATGLQPEKIALGSHEHLGLRSATQQSLEAHFARHGFPDALFCSNDDIAVGAYRALRKVGRDIPCQTAVIGCDDIEESQDHHPALTTIAWPFDEVCRCAWQMLMERIAAPEMPPRFERIKARFVPRASSQRESTPAQSTPGTRRQSRKP